MMVSRFKLGCDLHRLAMGLRKEISKDDCRLGDSVKYPYGPFPSWRQGVDGRDKPGHDGKRVLDIFCPKDYNPLAFLALASF
jgi:hypothetical protein